MNINKKIFYFCIVYLAILVFDCWGQPYIIMRSPIMEPTIKVGDIIFVDHAFYETQLPERWDIVVFKSTTIADGNFVMRIVGLPGEVISYDSLGIFIDGERLTPPIPNVIYRIDDIRREMVEHPYRIPENEYYLIGDNVNDAFDSRFWGSIPEENIIGKVTNIW